VPAREVQIIHIRQIARRGGVSDLRDDEPLQNALQRPVFKWQYESVDISECMAAYVYGIAKAYACVDENIRMAFISSVTFRLKQMEFMTELAEVV
jgi:death on curing protein